MSVDYFVKHVSSLVMECAMQRPSYLTKKCAQSVPNVGAKCSIRNSEEDAKVNGSGVPRC